MNTDIQKIQLLCFRLGSDLYAADIMRIKEIVKPRPSARLPYAPAFVEGVINLRGTVIPIIDLHSRFILPGQPADQKKRLLIVCLTGQTVGLAVDEVTEVTAVPVDDLRPPPYFNDGVSRENIVAVFLLKGDPVMLLNLDLIICPQEGTALYETMVSAGIKDCATSLDDALVKKPVVEDFGICQ